MTQLLFRRCASGQSGTVPRVCWLILAGCLALPASLGAATSRESVEQQMQEADEQLRKLDAEIRASRERKAALQQTLEASKARIGERNQRVESLAGEIAEFDRRLGHLQSEITGANDTVSSRKQLLADALRRSQQISGDSGLKALLRHDDPALANRLSVYTDYALEAQRVEIAQQIDALRRIEAAAASVRKDRNWLDYIQRKASGQLDGLVASEADAQRSLQAVDASLSEKTRTVAELKADQARLQSLMEDLEDSPGTGSGYFAAGKGSWPMPVSGDIAARFGEVKSVGHVTWDGLFIRAEPDRPVQTIADGEVVYSDWLNGFGMLVIVDHGDAWMSLYGGNREVLVDTGSWVDAGTTIATVGNGIVGKGIVSGEDGRKAHGVYFEIRQAAEPVDPEDWVSIGNGA